MRAALAKALPEHMVPNAIAAISPQGPLESLITTHISDLLTSETGKAPDQISRHDSFFALGGHSLMAVRLIARIQDATDTQIPLRALFDAKTIKDLAIELQSAQKHAKLPKITRVERDQHIKLSYAQERLWLSLIRPACAPSLPRFMPAMRPCA